MPDCVCGHPAAAHDQVGCLECVAQAYPDSNNTYPCRETYGPETAAKAAALIPKRIY
jgi:hypothetical protein